MMVVPPGVQPRKASSNPIAGRSTLTNDVDEDAARAVAAQLEER